jgi:hypothetical protein
MVGDLPGRNRFLELVGDLVRSVANTAKRPPCRVVICTECAPLLLAEGKVEAAIQLEQFWNELTTTHEISIMCGYVSTSLAGQENVPVFERICAEHSTVFTGEKRVQKSDER